MSIKREVTQKVIEKVIPASVVKEIQEVETLVVTLDGPRDITKKNVSYSSWLWHADQMQDSSKVLSGFAWNDTPEGMDFWNYVEDRLREIRSQLEDNEPI